MNIYEYRKKTAVAREKWFEENQEETSRTDTAIKHFCETFTFEEGINKLSKFINFEPATECAEWMGSLNERGYGWYGVSLPTTPTSSKSVKAHRLMYALFYGVDALPEGIDATYNDGSLPVLDHTCENPCCVNPLHLKVESHSYNSRKAVWKRLRSA